MPPLPVSWVSVGQLGFPTRPVGTVGRLDSRSVRLWTAGGCSLSPGVLAEPYFSDQISCIRLKLFGVICGA